MSDSTEQGGPGTGRGLPASHSGAAQPDEELFPDVLDDLRRLTRPAPSKSPPEFTISGLLRRAEVESQPLVLDAEDGTTYELLLPADWQAQASPGDRVMVHGAVVEDLATTTQLGPVLQVSRMEVRE